MSKIIVINGTNYTIQELKFGVMKKLWPYIQPKDTNDPNIVSNVLNESEKIITICLQNNYPEITDDFIEKNAEFAEVNDAIEILRGMIQDAITKKKTASPEPVTLQNQEVYNGTGGAFMQD